jgi:hypothetical protein
MAIDMQRPLVAALQAALDEIQAEPPKKRHKVGAGRALLLGAGLYTAGRVVAKGRGSGMLDAIQERLPHRDGQGDDGDVVDEDFDEEFDQDEPEDEADDDQPEGEADEDQPEGEADDEPEADAGEDEPAPDEEDAEDEAPAPKRTRGRSKAQSRR